jgi:hypothetical protein
MAAIFLGTPSTRPFSAQYVSALWQTRVRGATTWLPVLGQDIATGRNEVVRQFLKSRADFLLMHDSDATWHPDSVQRLADRNLPIVSGVIFKRDLPTAPTIGRGIGVNPEGHYLYSFAETINHILWQVERLGIDADTKNELLLDTDPSDLLEVDGAGAHFMLIRRDVLEKVAFPWYECTTTNGGEDFFFCRKAKAAGFKLVCDFSVYTGHVVGDGVEIGLKQFLMFRDKVKLDVPWVV